MKLADDPQTDTEHVVHSLVQRYVPQHADRRAKTHIRKTRGEWPWR